MAERDVEREKPALEHNTGGIIGGFPLGNQPWSTILEVLLAGFHWETSPGAQYWRYYWRVSTGKPALEHNTGGIIGGFPLGNQPWSTILEVLLAGFHWETSPGAQYWRYYWRVSTGKPALEHNTGGIIGVCPLGNQPWSTILEVLLAGFHWETSPGAQYWRYYWRVSTGKPALEHNTGGIIGGCPLGNQPWSTILEVLLAGFHWETSPGAQYWRYYWRVSTAVSVWPELSDLRCFSPSPILEFFFSWRCFLVAAHPEDGLILDADRAENLR